MMAGSCALGCFPSVMLGRGMQVTPTNVDIASVAPKWHLYTPEEVEGVIARL